jgi:hypothetical protein
MKRLACLLLVLAATACDLNGRVLLVGDSNISMSATTYASYLYSGYEVGGTWEMPAPAYLPTIAVVPGSGFAHAYDSDPNTPNWVPALERIDAAGEWDAVVLNMGVNDAMTGMCTTGLADKIDALYGALPADIPIIVLDAPYVPSSSYSQTCLVDVNLALQAAHYRWSPRTTYINVNDTIGSVPANQRYLSDGIHYSPASQQKIVEAVKAALDSVL